MEPKSISVSVALIEASPPVVNANGSGANGNGATSNPIPALQTMLKLAGQPQLRQILTIPETAPEVVEKLSSLVGVVGQLRTMLTAEHPKATDKKTTDEQAPPEQPNASFPNLDPTPENLAPYVEDEAYEALAALDRHASHTNPATLAAKKHVLQRYLAIEQLIPRLLWYIACSNYNIIQLLGGIPVKVTSSNPEAADSEKLDPKEATPDWQTGILRLAAFIEIRQADTHWQLDLATQQPPPPLLPVDRWIQIEPSMLYESVDSTTNVPMMAEQWLADLSDRLLSNSPTLGLFTSTLAVDILELGRNWQPATLTLRLGFVFVDAAPEAELPLAQTEDIVLDSFADRSVGQTTANQSDNGDIRHGDGQTDNNDSISASSQPTHSQHNGDAALISEQPAATEQQPDHDQTDDQPIESNSVLEDLGNELEPDRASPIPGKSYTDSVSSETATKPLDTVDALADGQPLVQSSVTQSPDEDWVEAPKPDMVDQDRVASSDVAQDLALSDSLESLFPTTSDQLAPPSAPDPETDNRPGPAPHNAEPSLPTVSASTSIDIAAPDVITLDMFRAELSLPAPPFISISTDEVGLTLEALEDELTDVADILMPGLFEETTLPPAGYHDVSFNDDIPTLEIFERELSEAVEEIITKNPDAVMSLAEFAELVVDGQDEEALEPKSEKHPDDAPTQALPEQVEVNQQVDADQSLPLNGVAEDDRSMNNPAIGLDLFGQFDPQSDPIVTEPIEGHDGVSSADEADEAPNQTEDLVGAAADLSLGEAIASDQGNSSDYPYSPSDEDFSNVDNTVDNREPEPTIALDAPPLQQGVTLDPDPIIVLPVEDRPVLPDLTIQLSTTIAPEECSSVVLRRELVKHLLALQPIYPAMIESDRTMAEESISQSPISQSIVQKLTHLVAWAWQVDDRVQQLPEHPDEMMMMQAPLALSLWMSRLLWLLTSTSYDMMQLIGGIKAKALKPETGWVFGHLRLVATLTIHTDNQDWGWDLSLDKPQNLDGVLAPGVLLQAETNDLLHDPQPVEQIIATILDQLHQRSPVIKHLTAGAPVSVVMPTESETESEADAENEAKHDTVSGLIRLTIALALDRHTTAS